MVIEVCHLSLSCLFVMLPLRKVTCKREMYPDREKQSMLQVLILIQTSFFKMPATILETGSTNIHEKQSLSSQNSQSNFGHPDISGEYRSHHSSARGSCLSAFGSLFTGHPLIAAVSGHPTFSYYLHLQFPFQVLNTPYSSSLVCSTFFFNLSSC